MHDPEGHADAAKLKQMLGCAESALASGDGLHFVGSALTVADVAIFHSLSTMAEIQPAVLAPYPKLSAFVSAFAALPAVVAYLASDARVPITPNEIGKVPHAGLPGYNFVSPMKEGSFKEEWKGLGK